MVCVTKSRHTTDDCAHAYLAEKRANDPDRVQMLARTFFYLHFFGAKSNVSARVIYVGVTHTHVLLGIPPFFPFGTAGAARFAKRLPRAYTYPFVPIKKKGCYIIHSDFFFSTFFQFF